MSASYVITGAGKGLGRAIAERLASDGQHVVAVDVDAASLRWISDHRHGEFLHQFVADIGLQKAAREAANLAGRTAPLAGWVNNAALFRDASINSAEVPEIMAMITANLQPVVAGCKAAIEYFTAGQTAGAIVNISSHQARTAVPGCMPYVTAKAAIEGLTRALAVEYGRLGIRTNAVAPGTIITERYEQFLSSLPAVTAQRIQLEMSQLHPLGRVAEASEVAEAVCFLLSPAASFVNGVTLPVDGGRTILAREPSP